MKVRAYSLRQLVQLLDIYFGGVARLNARD